MRDIIFMRLAAFACAVLGTGLGLVVLLDLLPRGAVLNPDAWSEAFARIVDGEAWQRLGVTLPLVLLALLVACLGIAVGVAAARSQRPMFDRLLGVLSAGLALVPPFWLGMLLALGVGGILRWLPASGFVPWTSPSAALASLILPALALGLPQAGAMAIATRNLFPGPPATGRALPEPRDLDRLARGLPKLLGQTFVALLIGAVLVESVFYLPGLGRLILGAAVQHDLAVLRSGLFVLVVVAALGMLGLSLLRAALDPELRR